MRIFIFFMLLCVLSLGQYTGGNIALATPPAEETKPAIDYSAKIPKKPEYGEYSSKTLEELSRERPDEKFATQKSANVAVAMVFYKLTGQRPNFQTWATATKDYKNTPEELKQEKRIEITQRLQSEYELMGVDEPITLETYVTLKQYDAENSSGFFVNEFKEDTFFTFPFNGEYYAVIPSDLMDYQFITMEKDKQAKLRHHMTNKNRLFMRLSLVPQRADASQKVPLPNGHENWLIAAKILDIEFWSPKDQTMVWRSNEDFYKRKNQLLNLYQ